MPPDCLTLPPGPVHCPYNQFSNCTSTEFLLDENCTPDDNSSKFIYSSQALSWLKSMFNHISGCNTEHHNMVLTPCLEVNLY